MHTQTTKRSRKKSPKPETGKTHSPNLEHPPLHSFFSPRAVAVIGATESPGAVGATVFQNLISGGFHGPVYPINPKRPAIFGKKAYPNVSALPEQVDLAVIVTPAQTVPAVVAECGARGIHNAVIISAGFKEIGPTGAELEKQVLAEARKARMRIIGPNCLGVMAPHAKLNATFAKGIARPGNIGFISQSGALCTAILDWSFQVNVGFSAFVSIGSMLDVSWGDLIYYLGDDPHTRSIVCYMETIGDARSFLSAAREVALAKPIILIKVGETEAAARAVVSHTGSLTGSNEVLDAAFNRVGVLRVRTISELFDMADVLAKQPRPAGPRLAMVTNAGGPGALATDMLVRHGGYLATLSPETMDKLNGFLPPFWSHNNPVDVLGDANAERYGKAVETVLQEPAADSVLVILTPQDMTEPEKTAEAIKPFARSGKPVLASWMGGLNVDHARRILNESRIPAFDYPDQAARAFVYMWRYSDNLRSIYETPTLPRGGAAESVRATASTIIHKARSEGRTILTEVESDHVLKGYGIPTVEARTAARADQAALLAEKMGFPVVLKLYSKTITHKTDVGGVILNLRTASEVRKAFERIHHSVSAKASEKDFLGVTVQPMVQPKDGYELIIGSSIDPQFGPVLLFGAGGQLVEVFKDRALALPPLNTTLARRMIEQTKIYTALKGVRGRAPVDLAGVEELLVRFSNLVLEQRWIKEIDINPLFASPGGLIALDARVVLHPPETKEDQLARSAIRPYPAQYVTSWKLPDGSPAIIRPIRPEDEPLMIRFHEGLSERSVHYRYFGLLKLETRISHERLTRICFNDYDREIALVLERTSKGSDSEILAVARLSKTRYGNEAEFAIIITDQWQGKGLGTQLMKCLVHVARSENLSRITGRILAENRDMLSICQRLGFTILPADDGPDRLAELELD